MLRPVRRVGLTSQIWTVMGGGGGEVVRIKLCSVYQQVFIACSELKTVYGWEALKILI